MALPKIGAPLEEIEVGGEKILLRVLTRAEQYRIQKAVTAETPEDELEILTLSLATDTALEETRAWYVTAPTWAAKEILDAIYRMSKLNAEEAQKSS